jgi:hypothetical protein
MARVKGRGRGRGRGLSSLHAHREDRAVAVTSKPQELREQEPNADSSASNAGVTYSSSAAGTSRGINLVFRGSSDSSHAGPSHLTCDCPQLAASDRKLRGVGDAADLSDRRMNPADSVDDAVAGEHHERDDYAGLGEVSNEESAAGSGGGIPASPASSLHAITNPNIGLFSVLLDPATLRHIALFLHHYDVAAICLIDTIVSDAGLRSAWLQLLR